MAPDTARAAAPPRHYWQLPTFVLGAAALAAAIHFVPPPKSDPASMYRATLSALRTAVERKPAADPATIQQLIRAVLEADDRYPAEAATSHYLAASGYVAVAETGAADAADYWALAARHFEQADPAALPPDDAAKRTFRAAKAHAATGTGDPQQVLLALTNVPADEDKIESARLIATTCLRLTPPDKKRARDELARYLGLPNRADAATANALKLDVAALSFAVNEPDAARKWLKDIDPKFAPPAALAAAKVELAKLAAADNDWAEAAKLYEAALAVPGLPAAAVGAVRYRTGHALLKVGTPTPAGPYLDQAAREPGAVGAAACVRLAELRIRDAATKGRRGDAAGYLEQAALRLKTADASEFMPARDVRAAFEEVIQTSQSEGDFAAAATAATAYQAVAEPGKALEKRAEVYAAWAAAAPADAKPMAKLAAADFTAAAAAHPLASGQAHLLRRAVDQYRTAGDSAAGLAAAAKLLAVPNVPPEDAAAAHLARAEFLPATETAAIESSLNRAMAGPGPAAAAARLKLATHHLNRGRALADAAPAQQAPDQARAEAEKVTKFGRELLEQIVDAATVTAAEKATHEEAAFRLGSQLMGERRFADAEARFRKQIQLYPTGSMSGLGRLWLACCLAHEVAAGTTPNPTDKRLQEAIDLLKPLLASADAFLRTQAEIRTLNTLVVQEKYDGVATLGGELSARYKGKADELPVAKLMFYAALTRPNADRGEALRVMLRAEEVFKALPAAAFPTDPEYSRDRWEKEIAAMRREYEAKK